MMLLFCVVLSYGAAGSLAATLVTAFIYSTYCLWKLLDRFTLDRSIIKAALDFSWPLIVVGCLNYFFSGIDRAFLAGFKDDQNFGLYNIAFRLTSYIGILYAAITMTIEPDFYKAIAQKKYKRLMIIISGLLIAKTIIVVFFNILAPVIVKILTAGRYMDAVHYARILSVKNLTSSVFTMMTIVIVGLGYSKITLMNRLVGTLGVVVMYKLLIHYFGFDGAAWGQVFSYVILTLFSLIFIIFKILKSRRNRELNATQT
jgi:O-antigen/teichoic acid export membrane protein